MSASEPFTPDASTVRAAAARFGTPLYLYDEPTLRARAAEVTNFGGPFGFTPRFAIKANPSRRVLRILADRGLHFDASTTFEARRALLAGIAPQKVKLTAQILGADFEDLVGDGVGFTACSLAQLERFGAAFSGGACGVRINPGEGSGANNRTSVAGPDASFGVWHEALPEFTAAAGRLNVRITHAHHHVGSGGDVHRWAEIARVTLSLVRGLPDVTVVNLGGGFKAARMAGGAETSLARAASETDRILRDFAAATGRELHLEIEPGTWIAAPAGVLVGSVHDVVSTGESGHTFVKLDVGMAEILRPSMYGAQHAIDFHPAAEDGVLGAPQELLVVGPCCESGDVLTPAPGDPEGLLPRMLPVPAPGDLAVVGGAGAYCAAMPAKHYNSIPAAPEVLRSLDGSLALVRLRESLDDLLRQER